MTTSSNENMPWENQDGQKPAAADTAAMASTQAPRSSLDLGSGRLGGLGGGSLSDVSTKDMLAEGAVRAKNMAHALMMIVYLLAKYVAVKVIWAQARGLGMRGFLLAMRFVQALYVVAKPHLERLKVQARTTTNQLWRAALLLLIRVVGPAEEALLKLLGIAKAEAAKLADKSTRSVLMVLRSLGVAFVQALRSGLSKPAVQKLAMKVIKILEDAHL